MQPEAPAQETRLAPEAVRRRDRACNELRTAVSRWEMGCAYQRTSATFLEEGSVWREWQPPEARSSAPTGTARRTSTGRLLAGGSVAAIAGGLTLAAHLPHATTGVLADVLMLSGGMAAGLAIAHLHE